MKRLKLLLFLALGILMFSSCARERIDAGNVGIKVNLYGSEKGVDDDIQPVAGTIWYNPFYTAVYEFPTYNQRVIWTKDPNEGSEHNEEFTLTSKDGDPVSFDVSLNYRVVDTMVVSIFKTYRKPLEELNNTTLRDFIRSGYKRSVERFTSEELYSNASEFQRVSDSIIGGILEPRGFIIENIGIMGKIRIDPEIEAEIINKVKEKQKTLRTYQKLETTKAEMADKKAKEEGEYEAAVWTKKKDEELSKGLTPEILRKMEIEAWKAGGSQVPQTVIINGNKTNSPFMLNLGSGK